MQLGTPFLDISSLVSTRSEQGLLGLAFDPNYAVNGRFYISYTDAAGDSKIVRYLVSGNQDVAQPGPDRTLLTVAQPYVEKFGEIQYDIAWAESVHIKKQGV